MAATATVRKAKGTVRLNQGLALVRRADNDQRMTDAVPPGCVSQPV